MWLFVVVSNQGYVFVSLYLVSCNSSVSVVFFLFVCLFLCSVFIMCGSPKDMLVVKQNCPAADSSKILFILLDLYKSETLLYFISFNVTSDSSYESDTRADMEFSSVLGILFKNIRG